MTRPLEPGLPLPTTLGPYQLESRLGAGGMGTVYLGRHLQNDALHAVKLLEGQDPEALLRFRREAEAMAAASGHPNVAVVHSVGQDGGRAYLALEYLPGGSLAQRLEQGPLAVAEALSLCGQLADGLAWVHARGVLHRDLKPGNVLFADDGTPKLVDFGLARLAGADTLTQSGTVLGTPSWMAPEQARGQREALDERTDVYGLGAVLYHALTGRPPFRGSSPVKTLYAVLEAPLIPPSRYRADLPPELDAICLRALARSPADRYPSAAAFRDALTGQHVPTGRSGAWPLAGLAGLVGAVGMGLLFALLWRPSPVPAPSPSVVASAPPTQPSPTPRPASPSPSAAASVEPLILKPLRRVRHTEERVQPDSPIAGDYDETRKELITWGQSSKIVVWSDPLVSDQDASPRDLYAIVTTLVPTSDHRGFLLSHRGNGSLWCWRLKGDLRGSELGWSAVTALAGTPGSTSGPALAAGLRADAPGAVALVDGDTGRLECQVPLPGPPTSVALSREWAAATTGGPTPELVLWRLDVLSRGLPSPQRLRRQRPARCLAMDGHGTIVAVGDDAGLELQLGRVLGVPIASAPVGPVRAAAFPPNRLTLFAALAGPAPALLVWNLARPTDPQPYRRISLPETPVSLSFSDSGEHFTVGLSDGTVQLWSTEAVEQAAGVGARDDSLVYRAFRIDERQLQPEDYFEGALQLYVTGSKQVAIRNLSRYLKETPSAWSARLLRAQAALEIDDYAPAITDLTRLLEQFPQQDRLYALRGQCWIMQKDLRAAQADLDRALELNPNRVAAAYLRGKLLHERGQDEAAARDLRQVAEAYPPDSKQRRDAEEILAKIGR